ncbi:MAG: DUF2911 domain-containing protein [Lewinellaceae bacterium]|nr:DUF2911 domain-containing protein [Lewinellaceae bacterium]
MKTIPTLLVFACSLLFFAQNDLSAQVFPALDKSPADISYYRVNKQPVAKVIYSRPQKNDREIFGSLVPYDKVWRTGANECSEITFYQDVMLGGQEVKAGTYALFTIPGKEKWTIILNKGTDQWGSYGYDAGEDVLRVEANAEETPAVVEAFSIVFSDADQGSKMVLAWDRTMVSVPVMAK